MNEALKSRKKQKLNRVYHKTPMKRQAGVLSVGLAPSNSIFFFNQTVNKNVDEKWEVLY